MRELGAVLGLSVGYFIKYHLDSRYVSPILQGFTLDDAVWLGRYPRIRANISAPRNIEDLRSKVLKRNAIAVEMEELMATVLLASKTHYI